MSIRTQIISTVNEEYINYVYLPNHSATMGNVSLDPATFINDHYTLYSLLTAS
ncbi:hypothetical protein [Caldivirga sp. MU80]|uniref:hypothetical protein n=1 Tax=Caldivirga sp. MU80 TaxID=1650354 RepID=UPI0012E7FBBF|nr:hypothetical protein [Caldivirga sp. MU80]